MIQCPSSATMTQRENSESICKTILGRWRNREILYLLMIIWRSFSHGLVTQVFKSDCIHSPRGKILLKIVTNLVLPTCYQLHRHTRGKSNGIMDACCKIWQKHGRLGICIRFDHLLGKIDVLAYETVSTKHTVQWRPKNVGYGSNMECLPRKTITINTMPLVRILKPVRTHVLITCVLRTRHKATGFKVYSSEFWSFFGEIVHFLWFHYFLKNGNVHSLLYCFHIFFFLKHSESRNCPRSQWCSWHLDIWTEPICFLQLCV